MTAPFLCERSNLEPRPPSTPTPGPWPSPVLITAGSGARQLRTAPRPKNLLKLPPTSPPCLFPPAGATKKAGSHSPSLAWPPGHPGAPPVALQGMSPSLGNCEEQTIFQRQLSPDLWASPYLNNKTYVLKHNAGVCCRQNPDSTEPVHVWPCVAKGTLQM